MPNGDTTTPTTDFTAAGAIALLEHIESTIPGFEDADRKMWPSIRRKGGYPNEYAEAAADIVEASPELAAATHFDTAGARNTIALSTQLRTLIKKAESFLDGVRFTDAKLRASLVDGCDQVNALAPGLARRDKALEPHIGALRHASRRRGGKKKAAAPNGTPPPAPVPPIA